MATDDEIWNRGHHGYVGPLGAGDEKNGSLGVEAPVSKAQLGGSASCESRLDLCGCWGVMAWMWMVRDGGGQEHAMTSNLYGCFMTIPRNLAGNGTNLNNPGT